jgi:hypothetical protein
LPHAGALGTLGTILESKVIIADFALALGPDVVEADTELRGRRRRRADWSAKLHEVVVPILEAIAEFIAEDAMWMAIADFAKHLFGFMANFMAALFNRLKEPLIIVQIMGDLPG